MSLKTVPDPVETSPLLKMPPDILRQIYLFVYQSDKVELEVEEDGTISTTPCRVLRVCRTLRSNIFECCNQRALRLVYTARTPAALVRLSAAAENGLEIKTVCIILMWELGCPLTSDEAEGTNLDGPMTKPWHEGWRAAFQKLPRQTELLIFDLAGNDRVPQTMLARVLTTLSFLVRTRTGGEARCRLVGCHSISDQSFLEAYTVNVIKTTNATAGVMCADIREKEYRRGEIGDVFDTERSTIWPPYITASFWRRKTEEEMFNISDGTTEILVYHGTWVERVHRDTRPADLYIVK